jgi:hypothetical protein
MLVHIYGKREKNSVQLSPHELFKEQAMRLFHGSTVISDDTLEKARGRAFDFLKEGLRGKDQVFRWQTACEVMYECLLLPKPHCDWADALINGELQLILDKMHAVGVAEQFPTAYPTTWPGFQAPF